MPVTSPFWSAGRNPLVFVFAVLIIQIVYMFQYAFIVSLAYICLLAYYQNISYTLQSRSAARDSNFYHIIAAFFANFIFFTTFRYLVRNEMPLELLAAYLAGTILGSVHGNVVSRMIERLLGTKATTQLSADMPQLFRFWPSILVLLCVLGVQVWIVPYDAHVLFSLLALTILDNVSFSFARIARSTDHYWFHGGAVLFHAAVKFLQLYLMINQKMEWELFMPIATGSVTGSLLGAFYAKRISVWLGAGYDTHVSENQRIIMPNMQIITFSLGLGVHVLLFGALNWTSSIILLVCAAVQNMSFAIVSRARQRNNEAYLAWASLFSNGVWFITIQQLVMNSMIAEKMIPYCVGGAVGSLAGQWSAMQIEKKIQAVMDE